MRARESVGMGWLSAHGVATPLLKTYDEGALSQGSVELPQFDGPWIVKPDVSLGGKGNSGLVRKVDGAEELDQALRALIGSDVGGEPLKAVVAEQMIPGEEFYLSVAVDGELGAPVIRLALAGGVGFDADRDAQSLVGTFSEPFDRARVQVFADEVCEERGDPILAAAIGDVLYRLWDCFIQSEAVLLELNPVRWDGERIVAVGVALEFDETCSVAAEAFRPEGLEARRRSLTRREQEIAEADEKLGGPAMKFLELQGDVGLLVVGGGASLLAFDYLANHGADPACYVDYSPGAGVEKLTTLLTAGLTIPNVRGFIIGAAILSLMDCNTFAVAIVRALEESGVDPLKVPVVVRLGGPQEAEAHLMLAEVPGLVTLGRDQSIEDACGVLLERLEK